MKIKVTSVCTYNVPKILEEDVRSILAQRKRSIAQQEYLDELIGDIDSHVGAHSMKTLDVQEVKSK